ncbi:MAG: hypothetical protein ABI664_23515, partial [bacterium]
TVQTRSVEGPWPVGPTCPVVTVVAVQAQRLVRVIMMARNLRSTVSLVTRVPIQNDVVAFDGSALVQDARFKKMLDELQGLFTTSGIQRRLIGLELATNGAPDAQAADRLEMMTKVLASIQTPIMDATHPLQVQRVRAATTTEATILDENTVEVSDLLVLTVDQVFVVL